MALGNSKAEKKKRISFSFFILWAKNKIQPVFGINSHNLGILLDLMKPKTGRYYKINPHPSESFTFNDEEFEKFFPIRPCEEFDSI